MKKILILVALVFALLAGTAFAQGQQPYLPMAPIPGVTDRGQIMGLDNYLNVLFFLLIALAAAFAVVKITVSGLRYMMSEAFGSKASALEDIRSALIGLVILLATYVILATINPCLVNFNIIRGSDQCGEIRAPNLRVPEREEGQRTPFTLATYCAQPNVTRTTNNRGETICRSPVAENSLAATQQNCAEAGGASSHNGIGGFLDGLVGTHWCTFSSEFSTGGGMRDRAEVPSDVIAECEAGGEVAYQGNMEDTDLRCAPAQDVAAYWDTAAIIGASTRLPQSAAAVQAFQEACAATPNGVVVATGGIDAPLTCLSAETATNIYASTGVGSLFLPYNGPNQTLRNQYNSADMLGEFSTECNTFGGVVRAREGSPLVECVAQ